MASVDVVSAERTLEIEANSVTSGYINGSNHLILVSEGGTEIDAGSVGGGGGGGVVDATDTVKGIVELATDTETITGTDTVRAVTPFGMAAVTATASRKGLIEIATEAEVTTGTDATRAVTPATFAAVAAAGYQPKDSDLTAIAGLSASNDDVIQRKSGAWTNRTIAQLSTDLGISGGSIAYYNVKKDGTVKGDGTTDDTSALNTIIAAAPVGSTVYFPAGTYLVSAPIVYKSGCQYLGAGVALTGTGATLKLKNGTNLTNTAGLTGILVPDVWSTNNATSGAPVIIENLAINGNKTLNGTSTACGVILMNYWSVLKDLYVYDTPSDGIYLTDTGANGTTQISNSASENRILGCKVTSPKGNGICQFNSVNGANLDGFVIDCTIADTGETGIKFDRSPGWLVSGCHLYGIGDNAIEMGFSFATRVLNNYIEDFGNNNAASTWYWGIGATALNDRGTHIMGNMISCAEPAVVTSTNYYYIRANAGSGQTTCRFVIANNLIYGANGAHGTGIVTEGSGSQVAIIKGNQISQVTLPFSIGGNTTLELSQLAASGSPTVAAGAQGSAASLTSGNNQSGLVSMTSKASSLAAGVLGTISFSKAYPVTPRGVIISATNGAASAAPLYATVSTTAITVSTNAALTASTAHTFSYTVL
jgi:hypothetical protein